MNTNEAGRNRPQPRLEPRKLTLTLLLDRLARSNNHDRYNGDHGVADYNEINDQVSFVFEHWKSVSEQLDLLDEIVKRFGGFDDEAMKSLSVWNCALKLASIMSAITPMIDDEETKANYIDIKRAFDALQQRDYQEHFPDDEIIGKVVSLLKSTEYPRAKLSGVRRRLEEVIELLDQKGG